jgi:hypothetical protein
VKPEHAIHPATTTPWKKLEEMKLWDPKTMAMHYNKVQNSPGRKLQNSFHIIIKSEFEGIHQIAKSLLARTHGIGNRFAQVAPY